MSESANCIITVTRISLIVSTYSFAACFFLQKECTWFACAHGSPEHMFNFVLWVINCFSFQELNKVLLGLYSSLVLMLSEEAVPQVLCPVLASQDSSQDNSSSRQTLRGWVSRVCPVSREGPGSWGRVWSTKLMRISWESSAWKKRGSRGTFVLSKTPWEEVAATWELVSSAK